MTNIDELCNRLRIEIATFALCMAGDEITLPVPLFLQLMKAMVALIAYIQDDKESYEAYINEIDF